MPVSMTDIQAFDDAMAAAQAALSAIQGKIADPNAIVKLLSEQLTDVEMRLHAIAIPSSLTLTLQFSDGKTLEFSQDAAENIGDYLGLFVRQRCLRQRATGNGDYRDGFVVFFRPDANGSRSEIVIEYGAEVDFSGPRPVSARGIPVAHAPGYTAVIVGGDLPAPVKITVAAHWFGVRWRWFSAPRPIVRSYADLVAMKAILPLDGALTFGAPAPAPVTWSGPMTRGGLVAGQGTPGDRPELGPITEHQAAWLISGGAAMEQSWRAQAEATGTMPFWARDVATGALVDLSAHPYTSWNDANHGPHQLPKAPTLSTDPNYFRLETSHMPAASYVPWLLTDDPYYLEGLQATANFAVLESNYHQINNKLPQMGQPSEVRGWAWSVLRAAQLALFSSAAPPSWLLPLAYWQQAMADCRTFAQKYLSATASPCTTVFKLMTRTEGFQPFMQDYLGIVQAWMKWTGGFPEWDAVADYVATIRMALSDNTRASGWPGDQFQVPYYVPVWDARKGAAAAPPGYLYEVPASPYTPTSFSELWSLYPAYALGGVEKQPGWTDPATWPKGKLSLFEAKYLPEARGALAAWALAGIPGAKVQHDYLAAHMQSDFPAGYFKPNGAQQKWAISTT